MIEDEVVREVRAAREAFASSHGYDIRKMVAALHELGIASGRELVRFAPRPATLTPNQSLSPTGAAPAVIQDSTSTAAAPAAEL
jgi:hypothetical protein